MVSSTGVKKWAAAKYQMLSTDAFQQHTVTLCSLRTSKAIQHSHLWDPVYSSAIFWLLTTSAYFVLFQRFLYQNVQLALEMGTFKDSSLEILFLFLYWCECLSHHTHWDSLILPPLFGCLLHPDTLCYLVQLVLEMAAMTLLLLQLFIP